MKQVPVLIAGGGPVGLTLAIALARQGVSSVLVNDGPGTTTHPKLDVVNTRSMEIFRQLGLAERIRNAGNPRHANQYAAIAASASGPFYNVLSDRHPCYASVADATEVITAANDGSMPLEPTQRIAQMNLEPVLLEAAQNEPLIDLRFGWSLYGFEQDDGGVTSRIHSVDGSRAQQLRSDYLVGCDGPDSLVRNFLNIDYDGTRDLAGELFAIHFRSDEVADLFSNREPYWHTWIARPGFSGLLVSPDAGRNDFVLHRPFAPRKGEPLEAIVDAALGKKLSYEIVQSGPWRPQFLVANAFGRGRVFIAGDAAHQYMPTGGLGMNTGVAEAHNLAWKLAACVKGWGGPKLLESYQSERMAVARRNRDHVKQCAAAAFEATFGRTDAILDESPQGATDREALAAAFAAKASRLYESWGAELGYRYRSDIVDHDEDTETDDCLNYRPSARPGSRLPNVFHNDGKAILDLLDPSGFTLLAPTAEIGQSRAAVHAVATAGVPVSVVEHGEAAPPPYDHAYILVRPDQHIAWRGNQFPGDFQSIVNRARGAL